MKTLKRFAEKVAIPIIDAAVDLAIPDFDPRKPMFKAAWYSIKGSYGFLASFMPEEAEDFMKQIGNNKDKITTELLQSKEFEQALIITFDALIRTRNEKKRKIVKRVFFKGYILSKKPSEFELERFYQTSQQITLKAVEYLHFIKKEIYPRKLASVEAKLRNKYEGKGIRTLKELKENLRTEIDSNHIREYIIEEFNYKSPRVKQKYNLPERAEDIDHETYLKLTQKENEQLQALEENTAELNSLGIFRTIPTYDYTGYIFTDFGLNYLVYLDKK